LYPSHAAGFVSGGRALQVTVWDQEPVGLLDTEVGPVRRRFGDPIEFAGIVTHPDEEAPVIWANVA
jgi:hypothetical protein